MDQEWRELAIRTYGVAWRELLAAQGAQREDIEFYIEELKETLLDLKQATIDEDRARVESSSSEVTALIIDLRHRLYGDE